MNLRLTKPIAFIDLETTGLDIAKDRIVEISILKIEIDGKKQSLTQRINPEMSISKESTEIHGISNKDVENEPTFREMAPKIRDFISNADLAGFNSNKFDIPLLVEEFLRVEVDFNVDKRKLIDVQNIFHKMEKRTLEAAYKFYCDKNLANAHSAEADVTATFEVLEAQLVRYQDLEGTAAFLHEFSSMKNTVDLAGRIVYNDSGEEVFNFGKYSGKKVSEVFEKDPSYYSWIMNADFTMDTKRVLTRLKLQHKK